VLNLRRTTRQGLLLILTASGAIATTEPVRAQARPTPTQAERADSVPRASVLRLSGSNPVGIRLARDLLIAFGAHAKLTSVREEPGPVPEEIAIVMQAPEASRTIRGEIRAHGSPTAFTDLMAGKADIGMASRRVTAAEAGMLAAARMGDMQRPEHEHVISLDGVAFIVHRNNPVQALTLPQLRDLVSGVTTRWSSVGGPDIPVVLYGNDTRSGTADMIRQKVLGRGAVMAKTIRMFESSEDVADAVAAEPAAIGFVGTAFARNARPIAIASECGLAPAAPTAFLVKAEDYPLSRRLYFYVGNKHTALTDDFLKFASSPSAQASIEHAGFASLDPVLAPAEAVRPTSATGHTPASDKAMAGLVGGAQRLSVTFRFELGKATLDSRANRDLDRVRLWMKQAGVGRSLILIGHSSSDGDFASNVALSLLRAREVDAQLRTLGVMAEAAHGVGPAAPVSCDTTAEGANLNRRVEVWIR
jgi:phosphate transport system substrate-binding protein